MENNNLDQFEDGQLKPSSAKIALINGIYLGIALIVLSLVLYLLDVSRDSYAQYLSYVVMIGLMIIFVIQWRDKYNGGYLSYSGAFGHGFLVILFGTILSAIYTYVFFAFIAPGELMVLIEEAEQQMYEKGMSDQEIEMAMSWTRMMMKPLMMGVWVIVGGAIGGLIISALAAIFLKKEPTEF